MGPAVEWNESDLVRAPWKSLVLYRRSVSCAFSFQIYDSWVGGPRLSKLLAEACPMIGVRAAAALVGAWNQSALAWAPWRPLVWYRPASWVFSSLIYGSCCSHLNCHFFVLSAPQYRTLVDPMPNSRGSFPVCLRQRECNPLNA